MSSLLLSMALGLVPPPPPPEEAPLDSLEADANEPQIEVPPPPSEVAPTEGEATEAPLPEAPAAEPEAVELQPTSDAGRIHYDAYGDPIVPFGESSSTEGELAFADTPEKQEELPFAEDPVPAEGAELEVADRPARSTMSRDALERQASVDLDRGVPGGGESPQRFAVEVKFGPYIPAVDDAVSGGGLGPYASVFGQTDDTGAAVDQPKAGLYSVISFEWQFINLAGPLSLGGQVGFFRDQAQALLATPDDDGNLRSVADEVSFTVVPLAVLLGYRFELLADRYRVPLVPYARGGLAYGIWWSKDGSGSVSENSTGDKGRGGSLGWQANLGMMLRMDWIDRGSANKTTVRRGDHLPFRHCGFHMCADHRRTAICPAIPQLWGGWGHPLQPPQRPRCVVCAGSSDFNTLHNG
jgi:hypothetical protein